MCNWYTYASIAPSTLSLCLPLPRATTKNNECTRQFTPFIYEITVVVVVDVVIFAAQVRISSILRSFITSNKKKMIFRWHNTIACNERTNWNWNRNWTKIVVFSKSKQLRNLFICSISTTCVCVVCRVLQPEHASLHHRRNTFSLSLSLLLVCLTGLPNWKRSQK